MKTITLERYVANRANTRFVTFFLLNARLLLSIRLKFISSMVLTDGYVEEQKKEFQVGKRASERVGLLFTNIVVIIQKQLRSKRRVSKEQQLNG